MNKNRTFLVFFLFVSATDVCFIFTFTISVTLILIDVEEFEFGNIVVSLMMMTMLDMMMKRLVMNISIETEKGKHACYVNNFELQ